MVTTTAPPIKTARASDTERVVTVLALAFSADPIVRWVYPDPHQYWTHGPVLIRTFGGKALEHGTAHCAGDYAGAALWLPPAIRPDEDALVALLERSVAERTQGEVFGVLEQMDAYHPSEPHWYLPLMGVDPPRQGKGFGSALLRHALAQCDRD
ncbi:MAG TPA: GNAT family N-acetyltransferase, partial [Chloroflexota bacterium]|nr:GNAT family N-acetyltransferase [Chloroflexota bacterium]